MAKYDLTLRDRFLSHVSISENLNDCWNWKGSTNRDGYSQFKIDGKLYYVHRVSFELFIGPIPEGQLVCHKCDNPGCCNPSHLFLGTPQDNMDDKVKKNRQSHSHDGGIHKLTEQNIYQIREMIEQGYTQQEIANIFGVSQTNVFYIKSGKNWGWLK